MKFWIGGDRHAEIPDPYTSGFVEKRIARIIIIRSDKAHQTKHDAFSGREVSSQITIEQARALFDSRKGTCSRMRRVEREFVFVVTTDTGYTRVTLFGGVW